MSFVFTSHALLQARRRGIRRELLMHILEQPEQRFPQRQGRDIFQSRVTQGGRVWLVRVVVDVDRDPPEVVTAYRTTTIHRYWRDTP
jgi:hypothetical protein